MAQATVRADVYQPANVAVHLAAQVALHLVLTVYGLAYAGQFVIAEVPHARIAPTRAFVTTSRAIIGPMPYMRRSE
jgi:hypothetical protein